MTVGELIAMLSEYDPGLRVFAEGYESGFDEPRVRPARIQLNVNEMPSVLGMHEEYCNYEGTLSEPEGPFIDGVVIERHQPE
jgi:hypothetical protein